MAKNEMIAMLLAGGKGTRLEALTKKVAKPAVYYGGKYRIIDFPMSNCANSGVSIVGVMTQYESIQLNAYIGSGAYWGFDGIDSKAIILSPRQKEEGASWYNGTADAIFQNMDFIDMHDPEYVLILSGDHIYKMDYSKMLDFHKANHADITIAVINVSLQEASRFGIMHADNQGVIDDFEEKPKQPKSTLASMGIYIFSIAALKEYLGKENKIFRSEHDFGKHIIPAMLADHKKLMAYPFEGYWKDVGTIESLWQANMDLLFENSLDLFNEKSNWKIYTEDTHSSPQYIAPTASVSRSLINQGCIIDGQVEGSILFHDVTVKAGAKVIESVILPGTVIEENAEVYRCIVNQQIIIPQNKKINEGNTKIILVAE